MVLIFMIWKIIETSLKSNLFEEWNYLGSIPWMEATLYDFYANLLFIYAWIFYKEKNILKKMVWLILLFCLGSVATCVYILIELFSLKDKNVVVILTKQNK